MRGRELGRIWRRTAGRGPAVAVVAVALALAFLTIDPPSLEAQTPPPEAAPPATSGGQVERPAVSKLIALPMEQLRVRANANDIPAMEELGRRLIEGTDATKDPQAGAGWLLRAAELGSADSAFDVGVMYERGFVVERNSGKAVEWYRKAADANLAAAKHNLALLLRDGRGAPRDVKAAIELLKSAAFQGMAASMFTLGDIYDRGDAAPRDAVEALAWFAVAAEFDRRLNGGDDTTLSRTADQRAQVLQRTLTPEEVARAQDRAQGEFTLILAALTPPRLSPSSSKKPGGPAEAPSHADLPAWPSSPTDQVRAVQQALFDLKLLGSKPDGSLGPMTRAAIRDFERMAGLKETGEPSKAVFDSLNEMRGRMRGKP